MDSNAKVGDFEWNLYHDHDNRQLSDVKRIESLEWAIRQALATPMIGELAKSILSQALKAKTHDN